MKNLTVLDHPLIKHKITYIKDKNTQTKEFRELVEEIAMLMAYEVTRDLPLEEIDIETPLIATKSQIISGKKLVIVPILRAGIGMVDGMLNMIPAAKVGHVGLYRDPETLKPVEYFCKLPKEIEERTVIVVDPMLATGGSASAAITLIKEKGARDIKLVCLVGCPEGVAEVHKQHPEVEIYLACMDEKLNEHGYILPGLGDAGDRIFGTM